MAAISEKDANIALLELSSSKKKKTQDEVAMLKREKDRLVQQLKQQVGLLRHILCYFFLTPHPNMSLPICRNWDYLDSLEKSQTIVVCAM